MLAALGPKMLRLAAEHADGAHPYFSPVEHTAAAREMLGPGKLLAPEQMVVLDDDLTRARELAVEHMTRYLRLPNYTNNLLRHGFDEDDLAGPSPRLVDAIVVCGDVDAVVRRVGEHHAAGADHVCIQVLTPGRRCRCVSGPSWRPVLALTARCQAPWCQTPFAYLVPSPAPTIACAAARRAIGTRNGEQLT